MPAEIDFGEILEPAYMRKLSISILRTDDPQEIASFAHRIALEHLCLEDPTCVGFELSVGAVFAFRDALGDKCLLKVLSPDISVADSVARVEFQDYLFNAGFPCPKPLMKPLEEDGKIIVAEEFVETGRPADGHQPNDRRLMAEKLYDLVELGRSFESNAHFPTDTLIHEEGVLWPTPHNILFDFERGTNQATWIDEVAMQHKTPVQQCVPRSVIGHLDWSAKHCRVLDNEISVVYDWDSTANVPESRILGTALGSFTYREGVTNLTPNLEQMSEFLSAYEVRRTQAFTDQEVKEIVSFLYYGAAYSARCEDSIDDGSATARHQNRQLLRMLDSTDVYSALGNR